MHFLIYDPDKNIVDVVPEKYLVTHMAVYRAAVVIVYNRDTAKFTALKSHFGVFSGVHHVALHYFGLKLDEYGRFIDDKDKVVFLLKYSGLPKEIKVEAPII